MTNAWDVIIYSSVVTRGSVCIAFIMAASHYQEVKAADVLNAYKVAPNKKFGVDASKSAIIVKALYGLMSAGALYRAQPLHYMWELGCKYCDADPDLWMKPELRSEVKLEYYS